MGIYLDTGNKGFQKILQSGYVEKTGLIALIYKTVGTIEKLTCISRGSKCLLRKQANQREKLPGGASSGYAVWEKEQV